MKTLLLYSRPACGLCEEMEDHLHSAFAGRFRLDWRDVDKDAQTRQQWGDKIPVLLSSDGRLLCSGRLDSAVVADYLA